MIVHNVSDAQHVPLGLELLHQRRHVGPGVAPPLRAELRVEGELVGQRVTGPRLSQSLQRREVDHVVSWGTGAHRHLLSDDDDGV